MVDHALNLFLEEKPGVGSAADRRRLCDQVHRNRHESLPGAGSVLQLRVHQSSPGSRTAIEFRQRMSSCGQLECCSSG